MNAQRFLLGSLTATVLWFDTAHAADHRHPHHHHEETPAPGSLRAPAATPAASGVSTPGLWFGATVPPRYWNEETGPRF